jgi:Ca-activated chloride channel family protein
MEDGEAPLSPGGTFAHHDANPWTATVNDALSTFAADVDTGSFHFATRFLREHARPPVDSVRVEEWVNAMHYDYAGPQGGDVPFAVHVDGAPSPLTEDRQIVRVGVQAKRLTREERKAAHIVLLVDISGSMDEPNKFPLVKKTLHALVHGLRNDDSVAIATYAGGSSLPLAMTSARDVEKIDRAIESLRIGGGTAMASGLELAVREANKTLTPDSTSRVIVFSDGDANIGATSHDAILKSLRGYVSEGITLSTVGFGNGNYNDTLMEQLADAGNGNYSYVDDERTAKRLFVDDFTSLLEVVAQDVKLQMEWNPEVVKGYRLVGYEDRDIADADFRNDKKDAGEIGAGHAVTALYEIERTQAVGPIGTLRVRWKTPRGVHAAERAFVVDASAIKASRSELDDDARTAIATTLAAEILRGGPGGKGHTLQEVASLLLDAAHGAHADERRELAGLLQGVR